MIHAKEILIVDDEVGIRELLSEILQDEGLSRQRRRERHAGARVSRAAAAALVLLDIWMPDTDGVTLLREWAAAGQLTMPVVMMSGHGTIETAVEATKIGAFDFLEKPVGLQKLLGTVSRALKAASAKEPQRVSLAALGSGRAVRDVERQLELLLAGAQADPDPGRARHRPRPRRARAAAGRSALGGARRTGSGSRPIRWRCSRRRARARCTAPRSASYSKAEQKGLAFLLPKLERAGVDARRAPAPSRWATSPPRASSTPGCCPRSRPAR